MRILKQKGVHLRQFQGILLGLFTCWIVIFSQHPGFSQDLPLNLPSPSPSPTEQPTQGSNFNLFPGSDIMRGTVRLDGRRVFAIATPAVKDTNNQVDATTIIRQRIRSIEEVLQNIANQDFQPESLQVIVEPDQTNRLPTILVGVDGEPEKYLMTVTNLDAQIHGSEPQQWAEQLTTRIREALLQARRERQAQFLYRQGLIAGGVLIVAIAASLALLQLQRRLKTQQDRITQEARVTNVTPGVGVGDGTTSPPTVANVQHQMTRLQQINIKEIQRRLLQVGQIALWGGSLFFILGLFPYTRPVKPWILSTLEAPLKALGIIIGIALGIRATAVLIDRFFVALEDNQFLDPEASQRLALRFSTFSRVFKSIATAAWIVIGAIGTLSVLGVDIAPLLAGAGIIGLALSLGSQSVIKDMINGFLIVLEDQYAVGDVIAVGAVSGLVENMNLRITQLRNAEGRLITIPNSAIAIVENLSKDWSRVDVAIDVAYHSNVDEAIAVISQVAYTLSQDPVWKDKILDTPQVLGIDRIDHTGVLIRTWIKTKPLEQWNVAREYRRRLKITLDEKGISIGIPQQSLELTNPNAKSVSAPIAPSSTDGKSV